MADAHRMNVGEGSEELIHVQLDGEHGHGRLEFDEMARGAIDRLGDEFEDEV